MKTQCRADWWFIGTGVNRRSLFAPGAALSAGALMAPRTSLAQTAERLRRVGWLSGTENVRPTAFCRGITPYAD